MDLSAQSYQRQQINSQTYDLSNQAYNQSNSAAAYCQYQQYYQYDQQYPYYNCTSQTQQDYSISYQQQETISIHPPGVPIPPPDGHNVQNSYYQSQPHTQQPQQQSSGLAMAAAAGVPGNNGGFGTLPPMHGGAIPPIGQYPYFCTGSRDGKTFRGGGHAHFGHAHGRGRGGGRGSHVQSNSAYGIAENQGGPAQASMPLASGFGLASLPVPAQGQTPIWLPPHMAWCELCRVDCNTPEVLEQHKNGKRHKKNLQVYEDLQKLNNVLVGGQSEQIPASEIKQEISDIPSNVDKSEGEQPPQGNSRPQATSGENKVETGEQKVSVGAETSGAAEGKWRVNHGKARGRGLKHRMRGGRGGKWMRNHEGSRKSVEASKPKEVIPLICELCNVKCESPVVFQSHLAGKKHLANVKRFQGHQPMTGQAALAALYPALQAIFPAVQALYQLNADASTSFAAKFPQPDVNGPQVLSSQPVHSVFPQGQMSQLAATTLASAPLSGLETQASQDPKLQNSASGVGSQNAEYCNQSVMVNVEAKNLKFEDGTTEYGSKEVNFPVDHSVVKPQGDSMVEAEKILCSSAAGHAVKVSEGETTKSDVAVLEAATDHGGA